MFFDFYNTSNNNLTVTGDGEQIRLHCHCRAIGEPTGNDILTCAQPIPLS